MGFSGHWYSKPPTPRLKIGGNPLLFWGFTLSRQISEMKKWRQRLQDYVELVIYLVIYLVINLQLNFRSLRKKLSEE